MSATKNLIFILSGLLLNCQEAVESSVPASKEAGSGNHFVSATAGETTSRATLQLLATGFGQSQIAALLKYDVETYTLAYSTTFKGQRVEASGLIMVPKGIDTEAALVSLQHGTTFDKDEAPSVRGGFQGLEFFASAGYITLMPDFLGYGISDSLFHPYYDREHSSSTVIDMLEAAQEFLARQKIACNGKLFLAGYSEGGYVTLAAAREIEINPIDGLKLIAVAAGAGGYDLPGMLGGITSGNYYAYPSYLAFVLMSYNNTYEWQKPLSYFFTGKYADALAKTMNGGYSGGYINSQLTTHVPSLFNPVFFENLRKPGGEPQLKEALEANSVSGWKTNVPIRLFHGTKDEIIPFENSQITLDKFQAAGSQNVTLTLIPGGTHSNSFEPMLRDFIPWFLSF
jgi:pimeloyl-ACP methyl ester carboxylesterase